MSTLDALRRNTLLRQYLHRFDERDWPEVVKLTMIIGRRGVARPVSPAIAERVPVQACTA